MVKSPLITVARHPAKPVLIYDGDCNFCKFWILRWQRFTGERVAYLASQNPQVAEQFPEIPRERFDTSVQLVDVDGKVYNGAEAVFRSLACRTAGKFPLWLYQTIPGVASITEWAYYFVARHREFFSRLTPKAKS
jgi:lipase maturation factor 1